MTHRKKVLITGASGLLGANAARMLFLQGYDLRILIRPSADKEVLAGIPCELIYGDVCHLEDVLKAVAGCDYVVHSASVTAQWGVRYEEFQRVNVTGTKNIVEACLAHSIKKLIYISTANTIGPGKKHKPGNELNGFNLLHLNSDYINTKYIAQQYVLEQIERRQLPAVILNPTFMIGAYDAKPSSGQIILYGLNKRILFYPPGGKNFVHVADVCTGIAQAISIGQIGEMYLLAGENLSYREFFKLLNKVSGQKNIMFPVPGVLLKAIGIVGSLLGKLSNTTVKLNYASAYLLCLDNYYSGKKSERELEITYTPVAEAIANALSWFQKKKYVTDLKEVKLRNSFIPKYKAMNR